MKKTRKKQFQYKAFLWLAPALILLLFFSYYPPIRTLILSFTDARGSGIGKFIGLNNYKEIFMSSIFWKSMRNVVIFIIAGMIVGNVMTIFLAELLFNL